MRRITLLLVAGLWMTVVAAAETPSAWTEPVEPFRIIGNVYYIGTADLTSYLITTPEGHILLDAPLDENVPHLLQSIEALGFDPQEIEIILNSHAHYDHAGGFAAIREITGARLLASAADAELLERGGRDDFAFEDRAVFRPVTVDGIVEDEQIVELGGVRMRALMTPGHTMGGTSWVIDVEEEGRTYRVLFANSMSAPGYDLVDNERYPEIMRDYRRSFARLGAIDADVFLSTHGSFFGLGRKIAMMGGAGSVNPFVDREASKQYVERWQSIIETQFGVQREAAAVDALLDRFHDAASRADGEVYFSTFDPDAIFIGTDAGERWTTDEFREFAEPYFSRGQGWTYVPVRRFIEVDDSLDTAWFDEILENESYGTTRGTGVLVKHDDGWKIVQYHLTIPVPNEIAKDVVEMIRNTGESLD